MAIQLQARSRSQRRSIFRPKKAAKEQIKALPIVLRIDPFRFKLADSRKYGQNQQTQRCDPLLSIDDKLGAIVGRPDHERSHEVPFSCRYQFRHVVPQIFPLINGPGIVTLKDRDLVDGPIGKEFSEVLRLSV